MQQTETSSSLKIKLMNISKTDLFKDLDKAVEFDQSADLQKDLRRRVRHARRQSVWRADRRLRVRPSSAGHRAARKDVGRRRHLARSVHRRRQPRRCSTSKALRNWPGPRDLEKIFDNEAYLKWNMFRKSDDSRYVGLCLPHVLMRLPYGKDTTPVEEFDYEENVDGRDHSKYLWGNAAYAFAARLTDAFARHEWCAAIRGVEGGGLVEGLPAHTFITDDGDIATKCPTEIAITDRRENELAKLGFIPLCYYKGTDTAVFMGAQSTQKPQLYLDDDANANSRLSTQLQYILACSRFAHFLEDDDARQDRQLSCRATSARRF